MPKRTTPLATLRRRQLLTQRALAEKAGVTQATLVALENGRATPRIQTMEKIATALEVDPLDIAEFNRAIEGPLETAS
jgi:transcriptional regulator with XRE-family HTH domain